MANKLEDLRAVGRGLRLLCHEISRYHVERASFKLQMSSICETACNSKITEKEKKEATKTAATLSNLSTKKSSVRISNPKTFVTEVLERLNMVAVGVSSYLHMQRTFIQSAEMIDDSATDNVPTVKKYDPLMDPTVSEIDLEKYIKASSHPINGQEVFVDTQKHKTTLNYSDNNIVPRATVFSDQIDAVEEKLNSIKESIFSSELSSLENHSKLTTTADTANADDLQNAKVDEKAIFTHLENVKVSGSGMAPDIYKNHKHVVEDSADMKLRVVPKLLGRKPLAKDKPSSLLSESSKARAVPSSRVRRLASFGGLAAGLGLGTVAEITRRRIGIGKEQESGSLEFSPFLSEANANRIVHTLCKVRGAALKIGQMLSLQDNTFINPQLQSIFERVRQSADFMPAWQLEKMMVRELGADWKKHFVSFDDKPFAAASIGQVHEGVLHDGRRVAIKVQYPGVAEGIDSDINNLVSTLSYANVIPEGFFLSNAIEVAKRELAWECDYLRERQCGEYFAFLVKPYPEFYVPASVPELCSKRVLTTELIEGMAVDKCLNMDQSTRDLICNELLELTLREVFQFGYMQTDPNWANFFYNESTQQIALVDFGACRSYPKSFVDIYIKIIYGAAMQDREAVLHYSQEIGFLTGHEPKIMVDAHVDAVMILGETLQSSKPFSFKSQNLTQRIQRLLPTMVAHRMVPPPDEVYSLHRKLSGVYLLCSRLQGTVSVYPVFKNIYDNYQFGGEWPEMLPDLSAPVERV